MMDSPSTPTSPDFPIAGEVPRLQPAPQPVTVAGNDLTVFVEWPPLLESMLRDLAQAKQRVWVETYIFANDDGGKRFAEALKERARAGLDVRVHYDAVGSAGTPASFFQDLQAVGVKVHAYHTLLEGLKRLKPFSILNRRNHRKLLIIDDAAGGGAGYFGGMNIVDNAEKPTGKGVMVSASSGWRDVHVRLAGPAQADLAESFERSWARAQGRLRARRVKSTPRAVLKARLGQIAGAHHEEGIHFFDSGPRGRLSRAARVYALLIRRAQHHVNLSMAYFIPVGGVLRALLSARKRRVRIQVVVPGNSDVPIVKRATAYLYDRLIHQGFRIYERRLRMLHSKVMVVDGIYTVVGSANLDPRSLYTNLEFVAVIRSAALARLMQRICDFERSQSQRITLRACQRIGWWDRQINRLAWMLRWWL